MKSYSLALWFLIGSVFIAGCGASGSETRMRNSLLVDEAVSSGEVSKDSAAQDADYNDPVASVKVICTAADNQFSSASIALTPISKGATDHLGLIIRLPKVDPGKIVEHGGNKLLAKTIYLGDESTSADLCANLKFNSKSIVAENEANLLALLEDMKSQKNDLPDTELQNSLLRKFLLSIEDSPGAMTPDSDIDNLTAQIELAIFAVEGESTAELIARQQEILTAIDICPSRIETMRNSHPLGPFILRIEILSIGSAYAPAKCGLGLRDDQGFVNRSENPMSRVTWGGICRHAHGSIRIPEGSTCAAAGFE